MTLLYASPLGADDARGWGQLGEIGSHMHAGTWKAGSDFHAPSLLARAERHRRRGEVDEAAELMRRAAMHGAVSGEERVRVRVS